jgi:hypothetical protein
MYTVKSEQFKNRWNFLISSCMDDVSGLYPRYASLDPKQLLSARASSNPLHSLGIADLLELRLDADR